MAQSETASCEGHVVTMDTAEYGKIGGLGKGNLISKKNFTRLHTFLLFFSILFLLHRKKNESGSILYAYGKFVLFRHISFLP